MEVIDKILKKDINKVSETFYKFCYGNQDNSIQIISHLLDNYIPKPSLDENNNIVLPYYQTRNNNRLAHHPFPHECAYQAFSMILTKDIDWTKKHYLILEKRLQIFIIVMKHFKNCLNENEYRNGYGRTVIQEICLKFDKDRFNYYPDYFKEFVQENLLKKYGIVDAQKKIIKDTEFGIIPPKLNDFIIYSHKLTEYKRI